MYLARAGRAICLLVPARAFLLWLVALVWLSAATVAATADSVWAGPPSHDHKRVVGHGQIRFDGLGPEAWAQLWRRQRRTVNRLRVTLTARLDRIVWFVSSFECIRSHEAASWSTSTGNGYFGGLQMDVPFQKLYGRQLLSAKGTANHWSPSEQIATAIVAYESGRGFGPWPNTARKCGLR